MRLISAGVLPIPLNIEHKFVHVKVWSWTSASSARMLNVERQALEVAGVRRTVNVELLDGDADGGVRSGDWVLIHVGFALSKVDEEEARATLKLLEGMGEDYEQELAELKASLIE